MTWPFVQLKDCARIVGGATPKSEIADYWSGDIPWTTPKDLSDLDGKFLADTPRKITEQGLRNCSSEVLPPNSVLFSSRAPIGHVAINTVPMATNQGFKSMVPGPKLDASFLYWWLKCHRPQLEQLGNGATFKEVSKAVVERIEIPLPPLEEQKRIAAILDHADELRRKRQCALDRLNQLGQAIFIEMFGEWDQSTAKTLQLGDHIDFLTSGSRGWAEYYSDAGGLFLRIQNVKRDELDLSDVAYVKAPATAEANRTRVQPGDVLLSITADLGRTAVIPEGIGEAYINQHLAIIRAKRFDPRFLSAALSSPSGQRLILKRNREGVKAGLNFDDVRSVLIPDVGAEREREYGARANAVECLKKSALAALAETEKLFASLQHPAFRGEFTASSLREAAA